MGIIFWLLYGGYLLLNVLDGLTTWIIIRPDKFHREANPVARWLFIKLGIPRGIIIVEGVVQGLMTLLIFWLLGTIPWMAYTVLGVGNAIFGWIVIGSLKIIRDLRKRERKTRLQV